MKKAAQESAVGIKFLAMGLILEKRQIFQFASKSALAAARLCLLAEDIASMEDRGSGVVGIGWREWYNRKIGLLKPNRLGFPDN